jgi:ankyrin repeat protein
LYVHISDDGGIFLIWGDSGREAWVTRGELVAELDKLKDISGMVLYSLDPSKSKTPSIALDTLNLIKAYPVQMIVPREPHPRIHRKRASTALMEAAYDGWEAIAEDLIERGASLEAEDVDGYTALMYASNAGQSRLIEILLAAGANPDARAADNSTPLMFAAQHGHADIVRQLIAAGADPSARGDHGLSALGFAEQNGHGEIAQYLKSVVTSESLKST